jgi:hypothetical protein
MTVIGISEWRVDPKQEMSVVSKKISVLMRITAVFWSVRHINTEADE